MGSTSVLVPAVMLFSIVITYSLVYAATAVDEDFSGTLNADLQDEDGAYTIGNGTISKTTFGGSSDRSYIRTVDTDYNTVDFVAELTFTLTNLPAIHFLGLGPGTQGVISNESPGVLFRIHSSDLEDGRVDAGVRFPDGTFTGAIGIGNITTSGNSHRARLTKSENQVSFDLDVDFDGTFIANMSEKIADLAAAASFLDNTNSRIFFGTASATDVFDDLLITVSPVSTVSNGSFESGTDPGVFTLVEVGDTNIDFWSVDSGSVDYVGTYWTASDGARSIDLNGDDPGEISQTIATVAGNDYVVLFDMSRNPVDDKTVSMDVSAANDTSSYTYNTSNTTLDMKWEEKSFSFTATAATTTLTFDSTTSDGGQSIGPALDNVRVELDSDGDGVPDVSDNCPNTSNSDQANNDGDTFGDACDNAPFDDNQDQADSDGDGAADVIDNCVDDANAGQVDSDADGVRDACDNAPDTPNADQADGDGDGVGDVADNCIAVPNADQAGGDVDGVGDLCDNAPDDANPLQEDADGDGVGDVLDNCDNDINADQADFDQDGEGDGCDLDDDNDGYSDAEEIDAGSNPHDATSIPNQAPTAIAGFDPINTEDDDGDDDDEGDDGEGTFAIIAGGTDPEGDLLTIDAIIGTPDATGLVVTLIVDEDEDLEVEFDFEDGELEITGPDQATVDALLSQIQQSGGISVQNGQVVEIEVESEDDEDGEVEFKFDEDGDLEKIEVEVDPSNPFSVILTVTATDPGGLSDTETATPGFTVEDEEEPAPVPTSGTLTLTSDTKLEVDHNGNIIIGADGIKLDCDDHTITGTNVPGVAGISVVGRTGITIKECHLTNFYRGISVSGSTDIKLKETTATLIDEHSFQVANSTMVKLKENTASDGGWGTGFSVWQSSYVKLKENTATGIRYGFAVAGGSHSNVLKETTATGNDRDGFVLGGNLGSTSSNILKENTASGNGSQGFRLVDADNNELKENSACGHTVDASQDASSTGNVFTNNSFCTTSGI